MNRGQCEVRVRRKNFLRRLAMSKGRNGNCTNSNPCTGDTHRAAANVGVAGDMWMQDLRHVVTVSQSAW